MSGQQTWPLTLTCVVSEACDVILLSLVCVSVQGGTWLGTVALNQALCLCIQMESLSHTGSLDCARGD